jgi:SAM-dependent methyltransferase
LQVLHVRGLIRQGARGLGFGCGKEPIPAALAAQGYTIVATDQPAEAAAQAGWIAGEQHAATLDALNDRGLCAPDQFRSLVSLREVDMNAIPPDLRGFDFVWSACSLEHLGSLRRGLDFIHNSVKCLKPGGVAVHTTEFNLSSLDETLEDPNCVVYRRCDIEQLVEELRRDGHAVAPVSFDPGGSPPDRYVDVPPYRSSPHLKLRLEKYVVTSIGLIVQAGEFT